MEQKTEQGLGCTPPHTVTVVRVASGDQIEDFFRDSLLKAPQNVRILVVTLSAWGVHLNDTEQCL